MTADIEDRFHFNTAVSAVMELVNDMYAVPPEMATEGLPGVMRFAMETVTLLLAPIVPHFAEELWPNWGTRQHPHRRLAVLP